MMNSIFYNYSLSAKRHQDIIENLNDAIVSDFPGLTKDRNYGYIDLKNKKTLLIDTGGIASEKDKIIEAISNQAWLAVEESELVIFLMDGSEELNNYDYEIISKLRKLNKRFISVLNKLDKKSKSSIKVDGLRPLNGLRLIVPGK